MLPCLIVVVSESGRIVVFSGTFLPGKQELMKTAIIIKIVSRDIGFIDFVCFSSLLIIR